MRAENDNIDIISEAIGPAPVPLELSFGLRPSGRLFLAGQVPALAPFRALAPDTRLWMRWVEPDRDDATLEIAAAAPDSALARRARSLGE